MPKQYPRFGQRYRLSRNQSQGLCIVCNKPKADARVTIQVDWFRGNDEVFKVHWACIKDKKDSELLVELTKNWNL